MHIFQNKSKLILSYVVITFGIAVYTFAWSAFMLPAEIVGGGVSGISSVSIGPATARIVDTGSKAVWFKTAFWMASSIDA